MQIKKTFNYLAQFKDFPTYQFERRIDAFMLPYLEQVINAKLKIQDDNFLFVYPEFPLKRASSKEDEVDKLSEYADYLLYSPKSNTVYLVEFKTEIKSIKESQFHSYLTNSKNGWKDLLVYYFDKAINNKKYWTKFVNGLIHIQSVAPELLGDNNNWLLNEFLLENKSRGVHKRLKEIKEEIKFKKSKEPKVKFIYLAPGRANSKLEKYKGNIKDKADKGYYSGLISLADFAEYTEQPLTELLEKIDSAN